MSPVRLAPVSKETGGIGPLVNNQAMVSGPRGVHKAWLPEGRAGGRLRVLKTEGEKDAGWARTAHDPTVEDTLIPPQK